MDTHTDVPGLQGRHMKFRRNLHSDVSNILADFPTKLVILSSKATNIL